MGIDSQLAVPKAPAVARHYGLDWLRIAAFALLILFHIGMFFVTGAWLVKTAVPFEPLSFPMLFVAPWRLGVLFIVSGYASRALIEKLHRPGVFAGERTRRLIIPLLFAMVFIIPVQSWITLQFNHGYVGDFLPFWLHDYFRFGRIDGVTLPEWEHLWFVFYLWLFTMILATARFLMPAHTAAKLASVFEALGEGRKLLWVPLVYLVPVRVAITFTFGESHGLFDDWLTDLIYFPLFLFGFGLAGTPALWRALGRIWKHALALALLCYAVLVAVEIAYPADQPLSHAVMALDRAALAGMLWSMAMVMLRLADTLLNRDQKWRAPLSEAVFPFYIVHQSAIVLIGWWLLPLGIDPLGEFAIILVGTVASCWLFYDVGRRIGWLRPLIGLRRRGHGAGRRIAATPLPLLVIPAKAGIPLAHPANEKKPGFPLSRE